MAGRILIANDLSTGRIVLKARLSAAHYDVFVATSRAEAALLAIEKQPDVALVDLGAPLIPGLALCRDLKADGRTARTAVIALAPPGDSFARCEALQAGADDVLDRLPDEALLLARVRSLMRAKLREAEFGMGDETREALGFAEMTTGFQAPGRIAVVSTPGELATTLAEAIAPRLSDKVEIIDPEALLDHVEGNRPPDVYVILIDRAVPHHGLRIVAELRSRAEARSAGIVAALSPRDTANATIALDLGADDVIEQPADAEELALRLRAQLRRKARADRLRREVSDGLKLAMTDPLTGLYNRRYALAQLGRIAECSVETGRPFAVMVLDLDRFKRVNDSYGHAVGDAVLVEAARRIGTGLRQVDVVARLGGEEFLVVLPETGVDAAKAAGDRLRRRIEAEPFVIHGLPQPLHLTVSVGVALGGAPGAANVDTLVGVADRALYSAKAEGRNQVTVGLDAA